MSHYIANVRDIEFELFEVLRIGTLLDAGHYGDMDSGTASDILRAVAEFAEGPLADSYAEADRNPPVFLPDEHRVLVGDPLAKTVRSAKESGWWRLGMAEEIGGAPAPAAIVWAVNEMLWGANASATFFFLTGPTMTNVLHALGTEEQRRWARLANERQWSGTMVLTEPDAGSDVGAGRTKAVRQPDGTWHLEGVKRFISAGDVGDTAENILHLVLARPEGAGPGTRGLSLFCVPKYLFDPESLAPVARNGVFATNVEHKMGLRSAPTCELTFGGHDLPAVGYLMGETHAGISQMFEVIQHARMTIGVKSVGTLSTGYLNALAYARTRVQGADLAHAADKNAPRIPIIGHPEVRRSLLAQKSYAEGLRALYLYAAAQQNADVAEHVSGADAELAARVADLLLPVVKATASERAYEYLGEALQIFGGSGYLQDYPLEQYLRDAKIDSLYEGTTAIQALDFFFRKIVRDGGVAVNHVLAGVTATAAECAAAFPEPAERLRAAVEDIRATVTAATGFAFASQQDPRELYRVGLASTRLLLAFGDLLIGWRLLARALVARAALAGDAGRDEQFYRGKIVAATFFANNVLPTLAATRTILSDPDLSLMDLPDAAY
ncbi:acyl-CoA dehydrogenase [Nocardia takedensis]